MNEVIPTPKITLTTNNIADIQTELVTYAHLFDQVWQRREQRENYQTYLQGLMLDIPNKSVE